MLPEECIYHGVGQIRYLRRSGDAALPEFTKIRSEIRFRF